MFEAEVFVAEDYGNSCVRFVAKASFILTIISCAIPLASVVSPFERWLLLFQKPIKGANNIVSEATELHARMAEMAPGTSRR